MKALSSGVDAYGTKHTIGDEWLITKKICEWHIEDTSFERIMKTINLTVLSARQYCYILDPVENGKPQYGHKKMVKGPTSFFLQPGETF